MPTENAEPVQVSRIPNCDRLLLAIEFRRNLEMKSENCIPEFRNTLWLTTLGVYSQRGATSQIGIASEAFVRITQIFVFDAQPLSLVLLC